MNKLISLGFGLLLFAGCDSTNGVGPSVDMRFLVSGQRWFYTYDARLVDSLGHTTYAYHDSIKVWVASTGDSVGGIGGLIRVEALSLLASSVYAFPDTARVWYQLTGSALLEVAYQFAGAVPTVLLKNGRLTAPAKRLRTDRMLSAVMGVVIGDVPRAVDRDSVYVWTPPRTKLQFPLTPGTSWDVGSDFFIQRREVKAIETVEVHGRTYTAARITTEYPMFGDDFTWTDWVSSEGLLKRSMEIRVMMVTGPDPMLDGGWATVYEDILLVGN